MMAWAGGSRGRGGRSVLGRSMAPAFRRSRRGACGLRGARRLAFRAVQPVEVPGCKGDPAWPAHELDGERALGRRSGVVPHGAALGAGEGQQRVVTAALLAHAERALGQGRKQLVLAPVPDVVVAAEPCLFLGRVAVGLASGSVSWWAASCRVRSGRKGRARWGARAACPARPGARGTGRSRVRRRPRRPPAGSRGTPSGTSRRGAVRRRPPAPPSARGADRNHARVHGTRRRTPPCGSARSASRALAPAPRSRRLPPVPFPPAPLPLPAASRGVPHRVTVRVRRAGGRGAAAVCLPGPPSGRGAPVAALRSPM